MSEEWDKSSEFDPIKLKEQLEKRRMINPPKDKPFNLSSRSHKSVCDFNYKTSDIKEFIKRSNISPEELHEWYLEATKELNPKSFNEDAQKPYEELTGEQKFIDKFIADKINSKKNKLSGDDLV